MKTPDYHNPQQVPESALNKSLGERFLLREEVGKLTSNGQCKLWIGKNCWSDSYWNGNHNDITYKTTLPLPPEYRDEEIDWKSPEKQADVRKMWAENPAMDRDFVTVMNPDNRDWAKWVEADKWDGVNYYYRPAQKPRERTQRELDEEACADFCNAPGSVTFEDCWHAACAYAREASRKGVA